MQPLTYDTINGIVHADEAGPKDSCTALSLVKTASALNHACDGARMFGIAPLVWDIKDCDCLKRNRMHKPFTKFLRTQPKVGAAFVAPTAIVIGDVTVGAESSLWYGVVVRGDINRIRIGARTNIQDGTIVHVSSTGQGTSIGDDVTVGHMVVLHDCTLQDKSFVGIKACVMDGATVESGAMVAAAALVTPGKVVRSGELWAGVPAQPVRQLKQEEIDMIEWIPKHYVELAAEHLRLREFNLRGSNK